ncbi:LamG-like jellyroll fold domain-containing protein [uncultured Microbacterium sp.]|uniref:LamG-like jellyroll fold domain-containing protein n=1 Tax=uncultured Microbacterium sp. TaxID=191216 RepID=UPI0035CA6988
MTAGALLAAALVAPALPAAAAPAAANGLKGEYFLLGDGADYPFGELKATVLDGAINYSNLIPVYQERVGRGDNAAVRWTGSLTAPTTGDYTFYGVGDNGFRLWVAGQQIIDFWQNKWDLEQTSSVVTLQAGQKVDFRLDNFQATGGAYMKLSWSGPGIDKSIVPMSALTPPADLALYPARASVNTAGDSVALAFPGEVAGTANLADHLQLSVDQGGLPVGSVAPGPDAQSVIVTPSGPIGANVAVRLRYDGAGSLTAGGQPVPAFDIPVDNASTYVLSTPWAKDVDPNNPLPEYPRPQLVRTDWQNLNGTWQFEAATAQSPTPFGTDLSEEVVVPYPIESLLSGLKRHEDHFVYRRTFEVPAAWNVGNGQRLQLNFGAVDYDATVYVNGTEVAHHIGGYEEFSADVTDALVAGPNELIVRVTDTTGNQPRGKQDPNPAGIFYTPASGIWQTVWMEPVAPARIDQLELTPDLPNSALTLEAVSATASAGATVTAVARDASGAEVGRATGAANAPLSIPIPNAHLWSPADPYLYGLQVTLTDGASTDVALSYSGMRSIEVKEVDGVQKIFLNGQRTFLLSTLDQGYWPDGVYTAPTDAALAWDIQTTKDLGFNTIRKHIKVEPARWYYHADQIGMLVWQDMPANNGGNKDDATRAAYHDELLSLIDQLDSTTSIIGWIPFNEGWGEWDKTASGQIADEVKAADPSRLVNAASGVNCCDSKGDSGRGDVIDWHLYTGPALPHPDATRASIDGEHGGFSLSVPGHVWPGGSVNPYGEVATSAELTAAYVKNTAALVRPAEEYLSGSVYTQITDVEGEVNGIWTYDRRVLKMDGAKVAAINKKVLEVGSDPRQLPPATGGPNGIGFWPLNEGSGAQSADTSGNAHTLTLGDGAAWTPRADGSSLKLNGDRQAATASVPELDTTGNFSVAAWVRMDALPSGGGYATIASADGLTGQSPFFLQYGDTLKGFAFSFPDGPRAVAVTTPELGSWHHLVGVRDAAAGKLKLYVDGVLAATESTRGGTLSDGTIALGRGQWGGNPVDFLNGAIDDVHLFDKALTDAEVTALVTPPTQQTPVASVAPPVVSGVALVGKQLTADPGKWDASGATFTYQWLRDGAAIAGATSAKYTTVKADGGKSLSVKVTATAANRLPGTAASAGVVVLFPATVKVSNPLLGISWFRVTVNVTVSSDGPVAGPVTVKVGNKTYPVTVDARGKGSVTLPNLKAGYYPVSAEFPGTATVAPAKSPTGALLILF